MTITVRSVALGAALVAAGAVGATALTGLASAASQPAAAPAATSTAAAARMHMRDVLHGSFTVATSSGTAVVDVQRGEITAVSTTSVTVTSTDGYTATYTIGSATTVRRDRSAVEASVLEVGDVALVRSTGGTADVVRALSPDAAKALQDRIANGGSRMGSGMLGGLGRGMGGGMMGGGMMGDADDA